MCRKSHASSLDLNRRTASARLVKKKTCNIMQAAFFIDTIARSLG
jgi:hypothetical protein